MKINKGFTLVELLAVVAILSLLVIIALPNIMAMFKDAKKNSFTTECKQIYKTGQQQWMTDSMFETKEITYARCDDCSFKELSLSGRKNLKYLIKLNKAGKVVEFYATDGTYQFVYEGDLLLTQLASVEEISDLNEDDVLNISNDEAYRGNIPGCSYKIVTNIGSFSNIEDKKVLCFKPVNDGYVYTYYYNSFVSGTRKNETDQLVLNTNSSLIQPNSYLRVYRDSTKKELLASLTYEDRPKKDRISLNNDYEYVSSDFIKKVDAYSPSDVYVESSPDFCYNVGGGCPNDKPGYLFGYATSDIITKKYTGPWITNQDVISAIKNFPNTIDKTKYSFIGIYSCNEYSEEEVAAGQYYGYDNCGNNTYFVKYTNYVYVPK